MSVPAAVASAVAALEAARASLPAGWTLGYEIPWDAAGDAEIKARRYTVPQRGALRLGTTLPAQLGTTNHILLELIAPDATRAYRWVAWKPDGSVSVNWGAVVGAMQAGPRASRAAVVLPDNTTVDVG